MERARQKWVVTRPTAVFQMSAPHCSRLQDFCGSVFTWTGLHRYTYYARMYTWAVVRVISLGFNLGSSAHFVIITKCAPPPPFPYHHPRSVIHPIVRFARYQSTISPCILDKKDLGYSWRSKSDMKQRSKKVGQLKTLKVECYFSIVASSYLLIQKYTWLNQF